MSLSFISRTFSQLSEHKKDHQQNGLWIMILAMLLIPSVDVLAKLLSKDMAPVQISFLRVALQAVFLVVAIRGLPRLIHSTSLTGKLLMASFLVNTAVTCMVWSLVTMPVANAVALFFIEPLLVMLLSSFLLNEKSTPVKYLLAMIGLAGAMVVIRPNWQLYGWSSVLPMLAALFYALYLITVRTVRTQLPTSEMQAYISLVGILIMGAVLIVGQTTEIEVLQWSSIQSAHWHLLVMLGFFSALTHWLISTAFSLSKATTLAPLRYLEIISATALGYIIFDDYPDLLTWVGTAIILGSGLCLVYLDRKSEAQNNGV